MSSAKVLGHAMNLWLLLLLQLFLVAAAENSFVFEMAIVDQLKRWHDEDDDDEVYWNQYSSKDTKCANRPDFRQRVGEESHRCGAGSHENCAERAFEGER